jgi:hypothetical protein
MLAWSAVAATPGEITGTVTDSDTGKPVSHARVTAIVWTDRHIQYGDVLVALTGADGQFRFRGLPTGECEVRAAKAGYTPEVRGNHMRSPSADLSVPLIFRLTPTGGLTVRVVDDTGSPVGGAQVAIVERGEENQPYTINVRPTPVSKDGSLRVPLVRGSYRIAAVAPGSGNLLRARGQTFLPTYYPGTTTVGSAGWVDVVPGKEVQVDVPIKPITARQIRGRLGFAGTLMQASILPERSNDYYAIWGLLQVGDDPREFRVSGLTPGTYVLDVRACSAVPCTVTALYRKTIQVSDTDIDNLVIAESDRLIPK